MNARRMILSGVATLVILIAINAVRALPTGVTPGDDAPQVYLIKKTFDICDQNRRGEGSGNEPLPGGSVPPSGITGEGEEQSGCVDLVGDRANEYLFTGEQMGILVVVRDTSAIDILKADLYVDEIERVKCNDITADEPDYAAGTKLWYGHDVSGDLATTPPIKFPGQTSDGFDPAFDKLYECIFTATPADMTGDTGSIVVVKAFDQADNPGVSVPDNVWLNPAITLDIYVEHPTDPLIEDLTFPTGFPGQTVYSESTLKIKNTADGGVDLVVWLAGTDLFALDGAAKCPYTNSIHIPDVMAYRCKIGTIFNNPWHHVPNPNDQLPCTVNSCQGATPLLPDFLTATGIPSILGNGHTAECWFWFEYPTPCIGDFAADTLTGGEIIIYARAI